MATNPFDTGINQVTTVQQGSIGFSKYDLTTVIGTTLKSLFSISAVVALFVIVYAGIKWFSSGGDSEKADEASKMIQYAALGLFIMVIAYALTSFVFTQIAENIGGVL